MLAHGHLGGIELHLHAVEQRVLRIEAGRHVVEGAQSLDDAGEVAVRQHEGEVAGHGGLQRGDGGGLFQPRGIRAAALEQVAQALHHHAAAGEHVAQLGDIAAVFDGLIERLGEARGDQHGEVGVVRAQFLVGVAVAVDHGQAALVVLLADQPAGVHAEGAHLVFKGVGIVDQLGLVEVLGEVIHHRIGHLDAHADVHFVVVRVDVVLLRHLRKPRRAAAAGGGHHVAGALQHALAVRAGHVHAGHAAVLHQQALRRWCARGTSKPGRRVQRDVHVAQHVEGVLRAQMAHRAGDELDVVARALVHDLVHLGVVEAVDERGRAVLQIDGIGVGDEVAHLLPGQVIDDVAAHFLGEGELAVGKRARAGPAAHDVAGLAVDAVVQLARRAGAAVDVQAGVDEQKPGLGHFFRQLQGGEDARRAGADDDHVIGVRHGRPPSRHSKAPFPANSGGDGPSVYFVRPWRLYQTGVGKSRARGKFRGKTRGGRARTALQHTKAPRRARWRAESPGRRYPR